MHKIIDIVFERSYIRGMSRYLPLCHYVARKTGLSETQACLFNIAAGATIANTGYYLAVGSTPIFESLLLTLFATGIQGKIENIVSDRLSEHNVGLTKGGMILRSSQIAGFLAPYLIMAGLNLAQTPETKAEAPKPQGPAPAMSLDAR